jgi:hypothetical protein
MINVLLRITGFSDFVHHPIFWKLEKTAFRKLDLFPSSGEGGGETPTLLDPLERANLNHWMNPVILSVVHYFQNNLDSINVLVCSLLFIIKCK